MKLSRYWPLAIWLLPLAGCGGLSPASTTGAKPAELIENGNAALARGDLDAALDDFSRAVDAQADSARARERRAAVFLQMKKFEQARNDCNAAVKIDGKLASAYFTRGQAEKNLGETEKAVVDLTLALNNGLERVDVLAARGALYHSMAKASLKPNEAAKDLEKALKDFDRAVKLDARQAGLHMQRAAIELDMGDYDSAVADCNVALDADPKLAAARVTRARGQCELSEFDKAILDCDSAIHSDENLIEAYAIRAKARLEKASDMRTLAEVAQCDQAVDDCQKAIQRSKKVQGDAEGMKHAKTLCGLAHELRGSIYQNLRATKKALAEYERALSLDPYLVSALLRRAVTRSTVEDYAGAMNDCNTAISIDSARPEAYTGRGMVYAVKSEFPKAIEDFTQAVSLNRKCARAWNGRASVHLAMASQQVEEAKKSTMNTQRDACMENANVFRNRCIDDATKAIEANHHLASAYLSRGLAYAAQSLTEKAFDDFSAAIREDPKMARAYHNRGILLFKQLRLDEAIKDFEEASKLSPDNALYYRCLEQCWRRKGDPILANQYLKKCQDLINKSRQEQEKDLGVEDFTPKLKTRPELQPDTDLDPLEKAKNDLEKKLDATAEK